jgi:hypothetical protein
MWINTVAKKTFFFFGVKWYIFACFYWEVTPWIFDVENTESVKWAYNNYLENIWKVI